MADSPVNAPDPFFHDVKAHGINNGQKNSHGGQDASAFNHGAVRMSGRYKHGHPAVVFACPNCDRAGQLWEREDESIRCNKCSAEMSKADVVQRGDKRGSNLTTEARRRGARNGPEYDSKYMAEIGSIGGYATRNVDPRNV